MKRLLLLAGSLGSVVVGLVTWLRRKRPEAGDAAPIGLPEPAPPAPVEPAPAADADPAARDAESKLEDETKYERAAEEESAVRREAAERLRADPLPEPPESPPDAAA